MRVIEANPALNAASVYAKIQGKDLEEVVSTLPLLQALPPKRISSVLNRPCGVEIEVESAMGAKFVRGFVIVGDNSLRNAGIEFVSMYGLRVGHMPQILKNFESEVLLKRMKEGPQMYDFSERTSTHVHLDVRNFNESKLTSLLIMYSLFETALFSYVQEHRKHNVFCVPLLESSMVSMPNGMWDLVEQWDKYCAMNFKSIKVHGTVEFRHLEGCWEQHKILNWLIILSLLLNFCYRTPLEEVKNIIREVKTISDYESVFHDVFGPYSRFLVWNADELDESASAAKMFFNLGE